MTSDYFFTIPSELGRRTSMIDPLGFRAVAGHLLLRLAPGFTGRVRGRTWFPILCWAADAIEDQEVRRGAVDDEPRALIRTRRSTLGTFERALRMGAMLEGRTRDSWRWRYGNRVKWWETHRRQEIGTTYREADTPPFYSSRPSEIANNSVGCLRRSLERHALFIPSEARLAGACINVLPADRFRLTDRGRLLARAFESDLRKRDVSLTLLKEWGLYPEKLGRHFKNAPEREDALRKMARALPVLRDGTFDAKGFPKTSECMDALFQSARDPLFTPDLQSGPIPAVVAALRDTPDGHPLDAMCSVRPTDFWSRRLATAASVAQAVMGRPTESTLPLFVTMGRCFVDGARSAFPDGALDCQSFSDAWASFAPADLAAQFASGREAYLRTWNNLLTTENEKDSAIGFAPPIESVISRGVAHFNEWIERTPSLGLEALFDLHVGLPRFSVSRVLPLVELDAGGAFLDAPFPWSDVELPAQAADAAHDTDVADLADATAEADDVENDLDGIGDSGRYIITDYWYAVSVARSVMFGSLP